MIFDVNQTEFLSEFQKEVWYFGKAILPLEVTLPGIEDRETREGCTQIYNFTQEIFEDMYNNPDKYTDNRPFIYSVYLFNFMLGNGAVPDETGLCWKIPLIHKNFDKHFYYLAPFGFSYVDKGEYKILRNDKYPLFLKYWSIMEQKGSKGSADRLSNIQVCDFRLFSKEKIKTFEDLLRAIPDRYRLYFRELHDYVINKGGKSAVRNYDQHTYKYKNVKVMLLLWNPLILIPYWGQLDQLIVEAKKQPDAHELISYIQNEVVLCKNCGRKIDNGKTRCSGTWVEIESVKKFICVCHEEIGKLHVKNTVYIENDIAMLKRIIDIKFTLIDNI